MEARPDRGATDFWPRKLDEAYTVLPAGLRAFLEHPASALVGAVLLTASALYIGKDEPLVLGLLPPALGQPLATRIAFAIGCAVVVFLSSRRPQAATVVNVALGAGFFAATYGWRCALAIAGVSLLVYYGARRISGHAAMVLTAIVLCVSVRPTVHGASGMYAPLMGVLGRMTYYAFEAKAVRVRDRSLLSFLAYGPFSMLLWLGFPFLLSYLTYHARRPQEQLNALGVRQLYRSGTKIFFFAALLVALHLFLPKIESFPGLPSRTQAMVAVAVYVLWFLQMSGLSDFCSGVSNLSGRFTPDAFHYPFFAYSPFDMWRRWNIHALNAVRTAFVFPIARRFRSRAAFVLVGAGGYVFFHWASTSFFPSATPLQILMVHVAGYVPVIVLLFLTIPFETLRPRMPKALVVLLVVVFQIFATCLHFWSISTMYRISFPTVECLFVSMFDRARECFQ